MKHAPEPAGFQNSATGLDLWRLRGSLVFVDEAAEDRPAPEQYSRRRVTAQSTWKKSVASIVAACACRNFRQVVSVCRFGAGRIFNENPRVT